MTAHSPRARRGVTLTEILISILILGVGMISLATLFPIGLLRIREATRSSRSALLSREAGSQIQARNLFDRNLYPFNATLGAYYDNSTVPPTIFDPWLQDGLSGSGNLDRTLAGSVGPGLPVAYDSLWWALSNQPWNRTSVTSSLPRFGVKTTDTLHHGSGDGTGLAGVSAFGLQRISSILPSVVLSDPSTFVSPDDPVYQTDTPATSPLIPDLSTGSVQYDYNYSYMFTGQQSDCNEYTVFDGSVVVHNNRPFGLDATGAAGERVVEGVFGYGVNANSVNSYSTGNPRLVLLRWSASEPDPEVALGSWIADVTYEQNATNSATKFANTAPYPMQRCIWYRVAKRSAATVDPSFNDFRRMQITLTAPVRAMTLLQPNSDSPVYTNAALLCPSVVNVFPRVIYTQD